MMKVVWLACASLGLAPAAQAAAPQMPGLLTLGLSSAPTVGGAQLGMTFAAWESLPRAQGLSPRAAPSCSGGVPTANSTVVRQPTAERRGPVVCSYMARYGAISLTQSIPLTAKYRARDPHYTFTDGRLSAIRFSTSVDAFDALMARFTEAYGAPKDTIRDSVSFGVIRRPRVQKVWRLADQWLRVTDPAGRPDRLEVKVTRTATGNAPIS